MSESESVTLLKFFPEMVKSTGRFFFGPLQKRALSSTQDEFVDFIVHPVLAGLAICKGELQEKIKSSTCRLNLDENRGTMFDAYMSEIIYPLIKKEEKNPYKSLHYRTLFSALSHYE